jgi:hypothetical protein
MYIPALRKLCGVFVNELRKMARQRPGDIADGVAAGEHYGKIDHQHRENFVAVGSQRFKAFHRRERARAGEQQGRRNNRRKVRRLVG